MSAKDKLEIGLKPDAQYRHDNLPEFQQDDPDCDKAAEPTESGDVRRARNNCDDAAKPPEEREPSTERRGPEPR
jgi:hypothetical protein